MTESSVVGAIVLVGGRSSRMGRDKSTVSVDGEPMLERVCRALRDALGADAPVVLVAAPDQAVDFTSVTVLRDPVAHQGPLHGLAVGLAHAADQGWDLAYLAAVDHAALTGAHVDSCIARLRAIEGWAVVPVVDGHDRPLASAVRVGEAHRRAHLLIFAGERAARALFLGPGVERFEPAWREALRSHDRPEDVDPG